MFKKINDNNLFLDHTKKKKVLYISNIEVPYRVRFFNELANFCDLTVLYERETSRNRDLSWTCSEKSGYRKDYIDGINIGNEFSFSLKIIKYVLGNYDCIILGCFNSPAQIIASFIMRILHIPFYFNLDGETFIEGKRLKNKFKNLILSNAQKYFIAGTVSENFLRKYVGNKDITPYYFSSLSDKELEENRNASKEIKRGKTILVIGQYFAYKGMDVALQAAKKNPSIYYKFVGMGKQTTAFIQEQKAEEMTNIEIVPFLQKKELSEEYKKAAMLVLPSRQECWGLVINEAASFGTPIVSTWGSGAAVEFLSNSYPQFLAEPGNSESLYQCIQNLIEFPEKQLYSEYLLDKSKLYSIEKSVAAFLCALESQ